MKIAIRKILVFIILFSAGNVAYSMCNAIVGPTSVCVNEVSAYTLNTTGGCDGGTYEWTLTNLAGGAAPTIVGTTGMEAELQINMGSSSGTFTISLIYDSGTPITEDITINSNNTAGTPSTTPTVCIGTALTPITIATTGATGIGTVTGLPGGVSASWASNVITITGTPNQSGTFNYNIPLTGGCGSVIAMGTITVTPNNTAGTPSTTPTVCIGTALTPITIATTGATGIGTATGLPGGVSASWASNLITITGTPNASGTFNYTIPLNGGCGTVNATGTITVSVNNTAGTPSSTPTVCIGTALTPITIATTGATGIGTATGLPGGVSASWASNLITITGTPNASGTFNYTIPLNGGCGTVNATGTITVTPNNTAGIPSAMPTVCIGTAISSITIATTGATGIGTATGLPGGVSATWASNVITITGTPNESGTFDYTIPLTGGCGDVDAMGTITVLTSNTAGTPSSMPTVCIGAAIAPITIATTGATGIGTATGLPGGISASWAGNVITITGTPNASGTFEYTIPLTGGCGTVNATGTITVSVNNTVGSPSSSPTLCIGTGLTSITITTTGATGIGTATGLPSGVSASWASNLITITGTPSASGNFSYSIPLTGGCGSVNATGTITVTPNNTAATAAEQTLCINTNLTNITIATTGATGIGSASGLPAGVGASWSNNVITISGTPTVSGTFNYTIPLTGGCGNVNATGTINVTPNNTAEAAAEQTLCLGSVLSDITINTTGATGIDQAIGLPAGVSASWAGNVITISGTPSASGTFNYNIPLSGGCGNVSATGMITVNVRPNLEIGGSTAFCEGSSTTLRAQEPGGNQPSDWMYDWSNNSNNSSIEVSEAGTYSVIVTDGNGCTREVSVEVEENQSIMFPISASNGLELCGDETTILSGPQNDNYTYLWSTDEITQEIEVGQGTYTLTVTDESVMCTGEESVVVSQNERPTAVLSANETEYCAGDIAPSLSISLTGEQPFNFTYTRNGTPNVVSDFNGTEFVIPIANQGTYLVTVLTDANCPAIEMPISNSLTITQNPLPDVAILPEIPAFCPGSTVDVSVVGSFSNVVWRKGANIIGTGPMISLGIAGTDYSVEVEDGNNCRNTLTFTVVEENNVAFEIQADPGTSICPGETITLDAGDDFVAYMWSAPGNETTQTIEITQGGTYSCIVTDQNGCTGSDVIDIASQNAPTVSSPIIDTSLEYCEGLAAPDVVFVLEGEGSFSATYSFNNGPDQSAPVTGNQVIITNAQAGTYKLTGIVDDNCSTLASFESVTITVQENSRPDFTLGSSSNDNVICPGEDIDITLNITNPGNYSYLWTLPDLSTSTFQNLLNQTLVGTYSVVVTNNLTGCAFGESIEIGLSNFNNIVTSANPTVICNEESTTLQVINAVSQTWLNDVDSPDVNKNLVVVSPSQTTVYAVEIENINGCTEIRNVVVTVNPKPAVSIIDEQQFYCAESTTDISVSQSGYSYSWNTGDSDQNLEVVISEATTFSVTVTDLNSSCTNVASIDVTDVRERPTTGISTTLPPPIQTGVNTQFNAVSPETDPLCTGIASYDWSFSTIDQTLYEQTTVVDNLPFTFMDGIDLDIIAVNLVVEDACGCRSDVAVLDYQVIDNESCYASIQQPSGPRCIGLPLEFKALPDPGALGNPIFEQGYFTIGGQTITSTGQFTTDDGKGFDVTELSSTLPNDNGTITVEFSDPGGYQIDYFFQYNGCEGTSPKFTFNVNGLPSFESIDFTDPVCNNEDQVLKFVIAGSSYDYKLSYVVNEGATQTRDFKPSSTKQITIAKENLNFGSNTVEFTSLIENNTQCSNPEIDQTFNFDFLTPLSVEFADMCSTDLDSIFYTITLDGSNGVGNYAINALDSLYFLDGNQLFIESDLPGIEINYEIIDTACANYSIDVAYGADCDACYDIQQISVEADNPLAFPEINLCEGQSFTFEFPKVFPELLLDDHKIVYLVQATASTNYDDSNIIQKYVRSNEGGVDNRFSVEISQDMLENDVTYFFTAFIVLNPETLEPVEGCTGLSNVPLRWYSNSRSTIGLETDEDGVACQQEIDYQFFIITDPADDLKQISYEWNSSGDVSFSPENQNIDIDGDRALAVFGNNPAGPLEIYLTQTYTIPGRDCAAIDTLEIEISEIVSPSEDTIIGFPGDLFTFPVSGLCYQWGLNEDLIPGETTQYLALQNGLGNNILWVDVYDCSDTDPDGLCVTRVYYNAPEPPTLVYKPNEELDIKLIPNPNNGQFTLDFFGDQGGQLEITVVNSTGTPVKRITVEKERRFQKEPFNLMNIDAGLYFIQVIDEGGYRHVLKFVKR